VCGICGRTGRLVAGELARSIEARLAGGVEEPGHECVGRPLARLCGDVRPGPLRGDAVILGSLDALDSDSFDVLVDFSTPAQAVACSDFAAEADKALVVATTGLSDEQKSVVSRAAERVPVVLASNTSVGANVLFALLERAGAALDESFDVEIVETHHRGKKDAPSGTALTAAAAIAGARGKDAGTVVRGGRTGPDVPRGHGEIAIHSVRGGAVAGRHVVQFMSDLETLSVEHVALSRRAFAVGAVRAARFAAASEPGLYDMRDVLGLRKRGDL